MSLTAAVFLACFVTGLGLTLFRNPIYGLYTYIAVFYLDAPSRWWGEGLPDLRWSFLTAAVTAVAMLRLKADPARVPWHKTAPAVFFIAYATWLWIQSPWAFDPEMHRECAIQFTKFVIAYWMVYRLIDTPELSADFLLAHVLGSFYLGLLAFTSNVSGRLDGVGGAGIDDSNTLGMHLATAAIAGAMLIFAKRDWRRIAAIVAVPFILNTVVMTGSRGAFLALFMGGLTIFWLRPRQNTRIFYVLAVGAVLGFGYVASETFWERMGTIGTAARQDESMDNSAEGRIEQFKAGLIMFRSHPLGVGHRGFASLSADYLAPEYLTDGGARSSHNTPLTALVEQGIPGAIMYFLLMMWIAKSCIVAGRSAKAKKPLLTVSMAAAVCGGLVTAIVGGLFADFLKAEVIVWLLALLASLRVMLAAAPTVAATRVTADPHEHAYAGPARVTPRDSRAHGSGKSNDIGRRRSARN